MTILTREPTVIVKGDSLQWQKSFADYAAPAWTLKYALRGAGSIDITAAPSDSNFLVSLTAAATNAVGYVVGNYTWYSFVEQGSDRTTLESGSIEVRANPISITGVVETRSKAKIILDNLLAAYQTYTQTSGAVKRYQIGDREMEYKDTASLIKDIEYWRRQVASEEAANRLSLGLGVPNKIYARFTSNI